MSEEGEGNAPVAPEREDGEVFFLAAHRNAAAPGRQAQVLLLEGRLEMAPSPYRSDEILDPQRRDLDTESPDPGPIRAIGVS